MFSRSCVHKKILQICIHTYIHTYIHKCSRVVSDTQSAGTRERRWTSRSYHLHTTYIHRRNVLMWVGASLLIVSICMYVCMYVVVSGAGEWEGAVEGVAEYGCAFSVYRIGGQHALSHEVRRSYVCMYVCITYVWGWFEWGNMPSLCMYVCMYVCMYSMNLATMFWGLCIVCTTALNNTVSICMYVCIYVFM